MNNSGSRNFLIGIVGIIIILFLLLQIVTTLTESGAIAAESPLPASLTQTGAKPTGDDFYKAATGEATLPSSLEQTQPTKEVKTDVKPQAQAETAKPAQTATTQAKPAPATAQKAKATTDDAKKPAEKKVEKTEEMVTVSVTGNVGRVDPFLPAIEIDTRGELELPKLPVASFHQPPIEVQENPEATKLMQTTISGIMFDAFSPSAIISVEGQDHLVRKGDRINGYKVLDITKNRVVVQNGTNIYRATVGETLTTKDEGVIFNNVDNLKRKFAGANAPADTEMIHIN